MNNQDKVRKFHEAVGSAHNSKPTNLSVWDSMLRIKLIAEELAEYAEAVGLPLASIKFKDCKPTVTVSGVIAPDMVGIADALADLEYVVLGSAVSHGIDLQPIFDEVHRSNMTKVDGGYRDKDGKWLKPLTWEPPNIKEELEKQKEKK